jgi:metal-dependent amidase/aminoacylase/carboxypeptidase family protein
VFLSTILRGDSMNNTRYIVAGYVENAKDRIEHIIDYLYKNPEVSFNEYKASELLCSILSEEGFQITKDAAGVKNSFTAVYGTSKPRIAYICEYDAADGIGHGNGHNITAAINTGAAIGLKRIVDEIGGSVMVIGCPAEEKHHTKVLMLNNGIFEGIDTDNIFYDYYKDKIKQIQSSIVKDLI